MAKQTKNDSHKEVRSPSNTTNSPWTWILTSSGVIIALAIWIHVTSPISPSPPITIQTINMPLPSEVDPLRNAEHLFCNEIIAPEDGIQLDKDNEWIWSMANGDLIQVNTDTLTWKKFTQTGDTHVDCGQLFMEEYCGRPLGLLLLPAEDYPLYMKYIPKEEPFKDETPLFLVADAYKGLLLVLSKGSIVTLLTAVHGKPLYFANSLARAQNGMIYISDTSSHFRRNQVLLEVLESRSYGRVVAWDPNTGTSRVNIDQLPSPNGLALVNNDTRLLISLTTRHQIIQIDPTNETATPELFSALPGVPDNLHLTYIKEWGRSVLWVGLASKTTIITKILNQSPQLRKLLAMLPYNILMKCFKRNGLIIALDPNTGNILHSFQDPTGRTPYISGIVFDNMYGYIGSWKNPFLGRIKRENLFAITLA